MSGDRDFAELIRLMGLAGLASAFVALGLSAETQAATPIEAVVAAGSGPVAGTWVLMGLPSDLRSNGEGSPHSAPPPGLLTIATDGHYLLLLGCKTRTGDSVVAAVDALCRGTSQDTIAHSGHVHADASKLDFHVDRSTDSALRGSDLSAEYALDGNQLTLAFDATRQRAAPRMQGAVLWQRLSGQAAAGAAGHSSEQCGPFHAPVPDLDRSAINEARIDQ